MSGGHSGRCRCSPGRSRWRAPRRSPGPDAGLAVLRLVDCSLLVPPQAGRGWAVPVCDAGNVARLRGKLRAEAGEQDIAAAALAGYALRVAEEAAAGLQTSAGEVAAARRLDAEDPTMRQVLAWAMAHDAARRGAAGGRAGRWWWLRGRLPGQYRLLREVAGRAEPGSEGWCAAQCWLGWAAFFAADVAGALGHFTAVRDAVGEPGAVPGAGRCPGRPVVDIAEPGPARRGGRGGPPLAGHGPGTRLPGRRGGGPEDARHRRACTAATMTAPFS